MGRCYRQQNTKSLADHFALSEMKSSECWEQRQELTDELTRLTAELRIDKRKARVVA